MKLVYGLTEEQMKEVHSIVEKEYYKSDIEAVIENGGHISTDYDVTNLELTDEEMAKTTEYMKNQIEENTYYSDYAREAIAYILDKRSEK